MLSGVQTRNRIPHDEYNVHGIAHAHAYRKEDMFIQRQLVQRFKWKESRGRGLKSQSFVQKVQPFNNSYTEKAHTGYIAPPKHIPACRSVLKFHVVFQNLPLFLEGPSWHLPSLQDLDCLSPVSIRYNSTKHLGTFYYFNILIFEVQPGGKLILFIVFVFSSLITIFDFQSICLFIPAIFETGGSVLVNPSNPNWYQYDYQDSHQYKLKFSVLCWSGWNTGASRLIQYARIPPSDICPPPHGDQSPSASHCIRPI